MSTRSLISQPKPFYLIFLIELWERFGFYGVQALLVLYMVEQLGLTDHKAEFLFTAFSALAYLLPSLGGFIGDRVLGTKRTILLGAIFLALGYLALTIPAITEISIIIPLAIIAVGNGLFKANPSRLLSKVYEKIPGSNFDSGFTLYYMAINIGATISMNLTPILNKYFGWHVAFSVCFIGLVVAIVNFCWMRKTVEGYGSTPDQQPLRKDFLAYVLVGVVACIVIAYYLITYYQVMSILLSIGTIALIIVYLSFIAKSESIERKGMWLFLFLFIEGIIFYVSYFQMPMSMTLFALRNVQHSIFGIPIQPAQFQMLNPLVIIIMSPILAAFYKKRQGESRDWSVPTKFAIGMLLTGISFLVVFLACMTAQQGTIAGAWLLVFYWVISTAELFVSALGLSVAARYVPRRYMGFTMGLWFLGTSIASLIAGQVSSIASVPKDITDPVISLPIYSHLFINIAWVTIVLALIMFIFVPFLKKLSSADKQQ